MLRTALWLVAAFSLLACSNETRRTIDNDADGGSFDAALNASLDATLSSDAARCVPPPGCRYANATVTHCGTLVCDGGVGDASVDGAFDDGGSRTACGTLSGLSCPPGFICKFDAADVCGESDGAGECYEVPSSGTSGDCFISQVCGCDGRTYDNECAAWRADVVIRRQGSCGAPTDCRTTGCTLDNQECIFCGGSYMCLNVGTVC